MKMNGEAFPSLLQTVKERTIFPRRRFSKIKEPMLQIMQPDLIFDLDSAEQQGTLKYRLTVNI